jgi:hypothetical protein
VAEPVTTGVTGTVNGVFVAAVISAVSSARNVVVSGVTRTLASAMSSLNA